MTLAVRITIGSAGGTSCRVEASVERYMCQVEGMETVVTTGSWHVKSGCLTWHGCHWMREVVSEVAVVVEVKSRS